MATIGRGIDFWSLDHAMFDALMAQHRERVTEAQLPMSVLCHLFAASKGVENTSPRQFLAYPPADEPAPVDPELFACDMKAWVAAYRRQTASAAGDS